MTLKTKRVFPATAFTILLVFTLAGCWYGFTDKTGIPPDIRTVRLGPVEKNSPLDNIQLRQRIGDRLRQKIIGQTRLSQTNSDSADWDIRISLDQYSPSTSAISNQQAVTNRLTVALHITRNQRKDDNVKDYDVSRSFEFSANLSLQQAENSLMDEMTRTLTDEIFNKLFSDW